MPVDRLYQVIRRPQSESNLLLIDDGDENDRSIGGFRHASESYQRIETAPAGHENVESDGVGMELIGFLDRVLSRSRQSNPVLRRQVSCQQLARGDLVINHQNKWLFGSLHVLPDWRNGRTNEGHTGRAGSSGQREAKAAASTDFTL